MDSDDKMVEVAMAAALHNLQREITLAPWINDRDKTIAYAKAVDYGEPITVGDLITIAGWMLAAWAGLGLLIIFCA